MINIALILNHPICMTQTENGSTFLNHPLFTKAVASSYPHDYEQALFAMFNYQYQDSLPIARIGACAENLAFNEGWWLRADPVQLQVDAGQIYLIGKEYLEVQQSEMASLSNDLQKYFAELGIRFFSPSNDEWYIQSQEPLGIRNYPLSQVKNRDILEFLPNGENQKFWRLLLTELQMLLFTHAVNKERQNSLKPLVNSLWFWGEGELQSSINTVLKKTWGLSSVQQGLAKYHGIPCFIPQDFQNCLENMDEIGNYLIAIDDHLLPPYTLDPLEAMNTLATSWFSPLLQALKLKDIILRVYIPGEKQFLITSKQVSSGWKKVWRCIRPRTKKAF